jgi:hypothetical protein
MYYDSDMLILPLSIYDAIRAWPIIFIKKNLTLIKLRGYPNLSFLALDKLINVLISFILNSLSHRHLQHVLHLEVNVTMIILPVPMISAKDSRIRAAR